MSCYIDQKKREPTKHTCGEYLCLTCHQYVMSVHLCYQRYLAPKKHNGNLSTSILNADKMRLLNVQRDTKGLQNVLIMIAKKILAPNVIYSQTVSKPGVEKNKHIPNYVAHTVCNRCMNDPVDKTSRFNGYGVSCDDCKKEIKMENI